VITIKAHFMLCIEYLVITRWENSTITVEALLSRYLIAAPDRYETAGIKSA